MYAETASKNFLVFYAIFSLSLSLNTVCFFMNLILIYESSMQPFFPLQPLMLIVPDVQDVYTPLQTDLILPVSEVCI